jgi:hypothetical protein
VLLFCCCSHRNLACGLSGSSPAQKVMPFFPRARRHGTSQILSGDDGGARPILYCVFVSVGVYLGSAVAYHVVGVIARLLPPPPWSGASSFVRGLLVGCVRHFPPAVVRGPTWSWRGSGESHLLFLKAVAAAGGSIGAVLSGFPKISFSLYVKFRKSLVRAAPGCFENPRDSAPSCPALPPALCSHRLLYLI